MSTEPTDESSVVSSTPLERKRHYVQDEEDAPLTDDADWAVSSGTNTPRSPDDSPRGPPIPISSGVIEASQQVLIQTSQLPPREHPQPIPQIPGVHFPPTTPIVPSEPFLPDPSDIVEPEELPQEVPRPEVEDKLEDEEATKPPVDELPPFAFDAYESDEETFFAKLPRSYSETIDDRKTRMRPDATEEKRYYETLVKPLEAYRASEGVSPPQMPYGGISSILRPDHLRAIARVLKDERLCGNVTSFQAMSGDHWRNLTDLGLKWILNGIHNNKSISEFKVSQVAWNRDDGERFVRFLSNSPHVTIVSFESMTVSGDAALKALLRGMPQNTTVRDLSLRSTSFSETTFSMLLGVISENTTLEKLNLRHCDFSYHNRAQRLMQAIIDNPNTKLKEIGWPLMRGAVLFMAQMLQYNQTISAIDLSNISLGPHVTLLQRALANNKSLKSLNLRSTSINDMNLAVLLEPLWTNDSLTELDISYNSNLTTESAKNLGDMLMQNVGLEILNVSFVASYSMGKDRLAKYIGRALKTNSTLRQLNLSQSVTESAGAGFLGEALSVNHGLQVLDLSLNSIDDSALGHLLKHIRNNHGLQSLTLHHTRIGDGAAKILAPWLTTTTTFTVLLDIGQTKMNDSGLIAVKEAIRSNPALRSLELRPLVVLNGPKVASPRGKH